MATFEPLLDWPGVQFEHLAHLSVFGDVHDRG
jgi:hypothetical protein